jgi:hypothetical protein
MEVSGEPHALVALPLGKELRYAFNERFGGPRSRSGRFGENLFAPGMSRAPDCPASRLVTTLTELSSRVRRVYTVFCVLLRSCKLKTERKEKFVWVSLEVCGT